MGVFRTTPVILASPVVSGRCWMSLTKAPEFLLCGGVLSTPLHTPLGAFPRAKGMPCRDRDTDHRPGAQTDAEAQTGVD